MKLRITSVHLRRTVLVLICTACLIVHVNHVQRLQTQHPKPLSKFNVQQALQHTQSVCLLLMSHTDGIRMSAESATISSHKSTPIHYWDVNCQDSYAREIAHFLWDTDTGGLLLAYFSLPPHTVEATRIDRAGALRQARNWLDLLNHDLGAGWRIEPEAKLVNRRWIVFADRAQRRLCMIVDAVDGDLRCIMLL